MEVTPAATGHSASVAHAHATLQDKVKDAERSFVLKDYRQALQLSNQVILSAERRSPFDQEANCVCLQTRALDRLSHESIEYTCVVRMTCDISLEDRAAAVALQSCHELSNKDNSGDPVQRQRLLGPFLALYRERPMPFEVAVLWIQYCFCKETLRHAAVEMAAELLHHARQYTLDTSDDLLCFLLTRMLPYANAGDYVRDVLDRIHSLSWTTSSKIYVQTAKVNPEAVHVILADLDSFSPSSSLEHCREQLELHAGPLSNSKHVQVVAMEDDILIQSRHIVGWRHQLALAFRNRQDWQTEWSKRLVNVFRIRVIQPLYLNDEKWINRGRVALSALLVYLAWKKRRNLLPLTTSAANLVTSPFREVLDALMPAPR